MWETLRTGADRSVFRRISIVYSVFSHPTSAREASVKVIHLIGGGDTGGAKTHVHSLLTYLGQVVDVRLVCFRRGIFSDEAQALGIPTIVMQHNVLWCVCALQKLIREEGYQFVHCHGAKANVIGAMLRPLVGVPVLTTVHSDYRLDYLGRPFATVFYGNANKVALRLLNYRVCVSNPLMQKLIDRGFDPGRMFSIYNGLDFSHEVPRVDRKEFFAGYDFDVAPDDVIVGIAARLDPVKDIPLLLRAVALARRRGARLRLAIAGDGKQRAELEALAESLGIGADVFFLGWISDLDRFYGALDINALSSISESFPYALTEGARARLATVATSVGGVPDLIEHGVNGFLVEPGDVDGFASALVTFAKDPALREKMGQALYDTGRQRLSVIATGERQLEIYNTIYRHEKWRHGKRDGILIGGAYGFGNAGDDAILEAILQEMRAIDPNMPVTVLSRRPHETRRIYGVSTLHSFNLIRMARVLRRTKLYLNGGGNLMQDVTSRMSLWYYLYTLWCAKRCGAQVQMYGCGIGPIVVPGDQKLAARTINRNVDVITLREPDSLDVLRQFGIEKPEVLLAADPVIRLQAASAFQVERFFEQHGMDPDGKYIAFVLRRWRGFEERTRAFAAAAWHAYTRYGLTPVFLCINPRADIDAARLVTEELTVPHYLIDEPMPAALSIGVMSRMQAVLSMRLHGLVFAAGQGVPLAGVSYDPKVRAFLDYIEQDNYVELEDADAKNMCAMIDRAISLSGQKDELRRRTELLYAREDNNQIAAARLLGRE